MLFWSRGSIYGAYKLLSNILETNECECKIKIKKTYFKEQSM